MALSSRPLQRHQSLHEQTYQALRNAILSGDLVAGSRLVETQIADLLEVSRTPVRESIRQLQRENLIVTDATGSLRVAMLSIVDAMQLYDCRIALEQLSVSEACCNVTNEQLKRLEQAIVQAEKAFGEPNQLTHFQLLHMDYQFHRLLAESSANNWLVQILDQVFDKMALLRLRTVQHNPGVLEIRGEHRRIYEAVRDRNPIAATQAIQAHLISSKERVVREIKVLEPRSLGSADSVEADSIW
ncbi:GntR family transcriptional regulator [Phormidium sp. CLA17]|uniref:GntR family transcriptional regulator n=1 Tax=Leptolyngbya sp. Cla-17 TaxID=2803751 RepID=UPI001491E4F2|nr:GntR family transcriptional regulator [Leptolyngbya sp. Cla-17]MBM0744036.1 GntR family transcriptional regulator [Leptolyngbya sp. Cla-17]